METQRLETGLLGPVITQEMDDLLTLLINFLILNLDLQRFVTCGVC